MAKNKRVKKWKCGHCGRNIGDRVPHRCKGSMRYKNLVFIDRVTGAIFKEHKDIGWAADDEMKQLYVDSTKRCAYSCFKLMCDDVINKYFGMLEEEIEKMYIDKMELVQKIGDEVCEGCGPNTDCGENPHECPGVQNAIRYLDKYNNEKEGKQ